MTPHEERATAADYCTRLDQAEFDWSSDFHDGPDEIIYCGYYYLLDEGEREFASRVMARLPAVRRSHFLCLPFAEIRKGQRRGRSLDHYYGCPIVASRPRGCTCPEIAASNAPSSLYRRYGHCRQSSCREISGAPSIWATRSRPRERWLSRASFVGGRPRSDLLVHRAKGYCRRQGQDRRPDGRA